MTKRFFFTISALVLASGFLFISILRTASVRYSFSEVYSNYTDELIHEEISRIDNYYVDYVLPYPGSVRPGDIMWYIKATRDRLWLMVTPDSGKKADLYQLFSDKRLVMAYELFAEHEPELGFSTLTKAEKYMLQASQLEEKMRKSGVDTRELSERLMKASIVHTLVIDKIKLMAPEDAIAELNIVQEFPRGLFDRKKIVFEEKGMTPPENPLNRI